jgi:hypothetical protein
MIVLGVRGRKRVMSSAERCDEILRIIDEVLGNDDAHRTLERRRSCES